MDGPKTITSASAYFNTGEEWRGSDGLAAQFGNDNESNTMNTFSFVNPYAHSSLRKEKEMKDC